jgi:hypothetical protein
MVCADDWFSPSIGRQGACSWHGGVSSVSRFAQLIIVAISLLVAFVSRSIVASFGKNSSSTGVLQAFTAGAHVYHPRFGHGEIVGLESDGHDTKILVSFGTRRKRLHLETAVNRGLKVTSN